LNDKLECAGERRFAPETLEAMRSAGVQLVAPFGSILLLSSNSQDISSDGDSNEFLPGVPTAPSPSLHKPRQSFPQTPGPRPPSYGPPSNKRVPSFDFDLLGSDGSEWFLGDDQEIPSRPFTGNRPNTGNMGRWMGGRRHSDEDDAATLRKDICRGLGKMDAMAAEAKRRNGEVNRCLDEVQADIARMTDRMAEARKRRERYQDGLRGDTSNTSHPGSQARAAPSTPKRNSVGRSRPGVPAPPPSGASFAQPPSGPPSSLPRRPGSEHGQRRQHPSQLRGGNYAAGSAPPPRTRKDEATGTRGMQSGFSFGGAAGAKSVLPPASPALEAAGGLSLHREAVRNQLLALRGRPDADKKACVKRLLVKWHPDRNPESIEVATSVFQYIQQEKEQLLNI